MKKILIFFISMTVTINANAQGKDFREMPAKILAAKTGGDAKLAMDLTNDYLDNYLFKLKENELMTKDNLLFICQNMFNTTSRCFKFLNNNRDKVNAVLGNDMAEYALRATISKQFIPNENEWEKVKIDWDLLENSLGSKFGQLGREMVLGKRMMYYLKIKDWTNFGKYYVFYFEKALERPEYNINDITWHLFLNVNNPVALKFAIDVVMKYAMVEWYQNDYHAYDTYANLLYKIGRIKEGLEWEEKAVKLSQQNKEVVETLEKMRRGEQTWIATLDNP